MCHSCSGTGGQRGQGLLRARMMQQVATFGLGPGPSLGGQRASTQLKLSFLVGGWGGRGMPPGGVDRNGNLKLCSKPLPVFKQFKAMKASGEKGRLDLDSKQTISLRVFCFLPPCPPLPDCYTGHPLPSVLVPLCPPR